MNICMWSMVQHAKVRELIVSRYMKDGSTGYIEPVWMTTQ